MDLHRRDQLGKGEAEQSMAKAMRSEVCLAKARRGSVQLRQSTERRCKGMEMRCAAMIGNGKVPRRTGVGTEKQ